MSAPGAEGPPPTEEELRAAYEAELSRLTATDVIVQAAVSLLNIGAHRLGPPPGPPAEGGAGAGGNADGRDLAQVRDAIDGASALLAVLERSIPAAELAPLRDALARLQMTYAREAQAPGPSAGEPPPGEPATAAQQEGETAEPPQPGESRPPGPAESSGRLWVPGS